MRWTAIVLIGVMALAACTTEGLIDAAFPDRERFAFRGSDGETVMQYACEAKGTEAATKANARRAHAYFDREMTQLVDGLISELFSGNRPSQKELDARIDAEAERIVNTTETQYQCLFYDTRDL